MTKQKMFEQLVNMANNLVKDYSYDKMSKLWDACNEWNDKHPDEEIFMCDGCFNDSETVNGFYIEDYYWIIED